MRLIDGDALIAWIKGSQQMTSKMKAVIAKIKTIPSADRPQGEWVPFEFGDERWHKCTVCGVADRYIEYVERPNGTTGKLVAIRNYCPNCGASMKGADKDIDVPYKIASDQRDYDSTYEPTYNEQDGSM